MIDLTPCLAAVDLAGLWAMLLAGDFLGFIAGCYTIMIGEGFYMVLMLVAFGVVFVRTRNLGLVSVIWTVLGTYFIALAPVASPIIVLLWILGITGILWSLYTGRK